ncbi:MAG: YheU family protein [Bdellovibrio sp.]
MEIENETDLEKESGQQPKQPPVAIPSEQLSSEIIDAVIESFILREGTDYGTVEISLDKKREQVRKQLAKNDVRIVYDFETESVTLMTDRDWKKLESLNSK